MNEEMAFLGFRRRLETAQIDPNIRETCLAITDVLSMISLGDGYHLGLPFFVQRLRDEHHPHLLPALSILCTMKRPLLSMHGYLDLQEGQHHLDDAEFDDLLQSGFLIHPVTGEAIPEPLEHVRIFYSVRDDIRDKS